MSGTATLRSREYTRKNYHIFTPPGPGRDWVFVWGCQPWVGRLPYANHAYSYDFAEGESGRLVLEFWITPFDYAPYEGPERAVVSKLVENALIGLSWAVLDYDESNSAYEGFWNLSHKTRMDSDASNLCAFRLMPLASGLRKPLEAQWEFQVVDMDRKWPSKTFPMAPSPLGRGILTMALPLPKHHPIHQYQEAGGYTVVLTVQGPEGTARRVKVQQVVVR